MYAIDAMPFSFVSGINFIWNFLPVWFGICIVWSVLKYALKETKSHRDYNRDEAESLFCYKKMGYALKADLEKAGKNISISDINDLECQLESSSSKMHRAIFGAWSARMNAKQIREDSFSNEQEVPASNEDKTIAYDILSKAVATGKLPAGKLFALKTKIGNSKSANQIARILESENLI